MSECTPCTSPGYRSKLPTGPAWFSQAFACEHPPSSGRWMLSSLLTGLYPRVALHSNQCTQGCIQVCCTCWAPSNTEHCSIQMPDPHRTWYCLNLQEVHAAAPSTPRTVACSCTHPGDPVICWYDEVCALIFTWSSKLGGTLTAISSTDVAHSNDPWPC
jgi:hypothetical protein